MIIDIPQIRLRLERIESIEKRKILNGIKILNLRYGADFVRESLLEAVKIYSDPETASNEFLTTDGISPFYNEINKLASAILRRETYKRALEGKN